MNDTIRDAAIEAAARAYYEHGGLSGVLAESDESARRVWRWDDAPRLLRDLFRQTVTPLVDVALAVAGPALRAEALRDAALLMRACKDVGHWNLRDPLDPESSYSPDRWLEVRADAEEGS